MDRITVFIVIGAIALLLIVVEMVRRRALEESYSLLWLGTTVGLVILAFTRPIWDWALPSLGIAYPPTALFMAGFIAMIMILLHFSTVVSRLTRQNRQAAQELGFLRWKLAEMEKQLNGRASGK